jgi:hypothetical protein
MQNTFFNLLIGPTTIKVSSLSMETEDLSGLPTSGDYAYGSESNKLHNSNDGPTDHQPINSEHKEDKLYSENLLHAGDSDMEIEDIISLPASIDSGCGIEDNGICTSNYRPSESDSQPGNSVEREIKLNSENLGDNDSNICSEKCHFVQEGNLDKNVVDMPSIMQVSVELTETVTIAENGCLAVQDESLIGSHKMDGNCILVSHLICLSFFFLLHSLVLY